MGTNPKGEMKVSAGGKEYRLHLGMSVMAELQEEFGDLETVFAMPEDGKLPNLKVVNAVFLKGLQRYHANEADRWLVDDIIAENQNAFVDLVGTAFPDPSEEAKGTRGKKKAAA